MGEDDNDDDEFDNIEGMASVSHDTPKVSVDMQGGRGGAKRNAELVHSFATFPFVCL